MMRIPFEAILFGIEKLGESFVSKAREKLVDKVLDAANNFMDYESNVKDLKDNLKSLSDRASDMEDEIRHAELSGNKKRKREVEEWLRQVKSIENDWGTDTEPQGLIMTRLMDGGTIARLGQLAKNLYKQSERFGKLVLDVRGRVIIPTTNMIGKAFQANSEKIWRLVEKGEGRIGVVGMGGVGKTALAENIHNRLVEQCEGDVFFVTVSQVLTLNSLQDKIAHSVGVVLLDKDEIKIRAGKLKAALSKLKNSVLILDDVWKSIDLSELGCLVPKECCKLIITTRSDKVCKGMECKGDQKIFVQVLDEDEAWELFSATLGEDRALSPEMEEMARSVAKLCGGLPLAVITVAGSMRGEESMHKWRDAKRKLKECEVECEDEESKVINRLKYSFDRLKDNESDRIGFNFFQLCFLYFSLYPEDSRILREDLVENLISDGLVERGRSRREEVDRGNAIVDHLVDVCLLESRVGLDGSKWVKMHDLIRAMALKITKGKYMVKAGEYSTMEIPMEQEWTEELEKMSLMCNDIRRVEEETSPNCPNLTTLLLQHNRYLDFIGVSFFCKMQRLRTLDLSYTGIRWLANSIFELKNLEAMLLDWCENLEHVPNLSNLKALRELHLDGTAIKLVPEGLDTLLNLKVLSLAFTEVDGVSRELLLSLVGLQILRLPCHVQLAIEEIQNLTQLEVFRGGMKGVGDFNSFITSLVHDHTTYKIKVGWQVDHEDEVELDFRNCDKAVILTECSLENENALGNDIECLVMKICEGLSRCLLDDLSRWNSFKSLKILAIESCGGIESIFRSEQAEVAASLFSTLEEIDLRDLEDLEGLVETGGASTAPAIVAFPSLTCLLTGNCMKMKRLGLPLKGFPKLNSLYLWDCVEIEEIFKNELGRIGEEIGGASVQLPQPQPQPLIPSLLTRFDIRRCNKVRKLGVSVLEVPNLQEIEITDCSEIEEIFEAHQGTSSGVALPKLQKLTLKSLPRLKSVDNATIICNSIQQINILECPVLTKKLPLHFDDPPPQSLKEIAVEREWWG